MPPISQLLSGARRFLVFWVRPSRVWRLRDDFEAQRRKMQSLIEASDHIFLENHRDTIDNELLPLAASVVTPAQEGEHVFRKEFLQPKGTGITARQAFFLELDCLARINRVLSDSDTPRHFPELRGFSVDDLVVELSFDGVSLDTLTTPRIIPDADRQIDHIVAALEQAEICHLDIHESGKNLLVDQHGRLTLIDFNRAVIGNRPVNPLMAKRLPPRSQQAEFHRARLTRCLEKHPLITPG
jgi:hypothetical protein